MAVLLDLDDDSIDPAEQDPRHKPFPGTQPYPAAKLFQLDGDLRKDRNEATNGASNGNEVTRTRGGGFSASLACYPVAIQIARSLDLNSLHALSRVCHQFRTNLLQFRKQLIAHALRCRHDVVVEEDEEEDGDTDEHFDPRFRSWDVVGSTGGLTSRITSGKIGPCARDMVAECRRCGDIVCRNCITKPRSAVALPDRLRRLCTTCARAPLSKHIGTGGRSFTSPAFERDPCTCTEVTWLCQVCSLHISNADTSYKRLWQWRTRYSTYLGGLGTGIAEGNEGVHCGRDKQCLAAKDIEMEVDCRAEDLSSLSWVSVDPDERGSGTPTQEAIGEDGLKAGYLRQEIYGVGGGIQKKFKKKVRIGKPVEEYEHEREKSEYLGREVRGESRSWCGWCNRVVPSSRRAS